MPDKNATAVAKARAQLDQAHDHIRRLAKANPAALDAAAGGIFNATGQVTFATAFIYGTASADITFDDGTKMHFYGTMWGLGLGGGTSWGGAAFAVTPQQLLGTCSFEIHSVAGVGGEVSITWWNGSQLLGTFIGAALAVSVSVTGGSGEWTAG